jgi:hypothetical protein
MANSPVDLLRLRDQCLGDNGAGAESLELEDVALLASHARRTVGGGTPSAASGCALQARATKRCLKCAPVGRRKRSTCAHMRAYECDAESGEGRQRESTSVRRSEVPAQRCEPAATFVRGRAGSLTRNARRPRVLRGRGRPTPATRQLTSPRASGHQVRHRQQPAAARRTRGGRPQLCSRMRCAERHRGWPRRGEVGGSAGYPGLPAFIVHLRCA